MERQTIILLSGIALNLIVLMIILLRRYIPVWKQRLEIRRLMKSGVKFTSVKSSKLNPISIVLMMVCFVLVIIPYVFTIFVIMSIKPYLESDNDLG